MGEGSGSMGSGNSVQTSNAQRVEFGAETFNFAGPTIYSQPEPGAGGLPSWVWAVGALAALLVLKK